ncbi:YdeI/OmpD-associated family protein [Winogradskyella sp. DF17]|uniref:YdeI/OmpD-associated family protein n=1 Tax=Winogradskyella pelagia TaxID=2819984 RepID=A0ABS3T1G6_9FLAO|nr:DUF1801 domain-containing protein [Winogradskyella sp. DF17]MBO3116593.1 YdeI/OmpD-associated family protein [Winogradskyella sp. DF17]
MKTIRSVDHYIALHPSYSEALHLLRKLILSTELQEAIKWGAPVYTLNGKNIVGLGAFKNHFGLWFFNGVFLKDTENLMVNAQENKTKALRQMRFTHKDEINAPIVLAYVKEAIDNQRQGRELKPERKAKPLVIPNELSSALNADQALKQAFKTLTPGKQREYCEHISSAKRETTKLARLEKIRPMILAGMGLYEKYKNC